MRYPISDLLALIPLQVLVTHFHMNHWGWGENEPFVSAVFLYSCIWGSRVPVVIIACKDNCNRGTFHFSRSVDLTFCVTKTNLSPIGGPENKLLPSFNLVDGWVVE